MKHLVKFVRNEDGATAAEYALLLAGVAVLIAGVVYLLGTAISDKLTESADVIDSAPGTGT